MKKTRSLSLLMLTLSFMLFALVSPIVSFAQDGGATEQELSLIQLLLESTLSTYVITFVAFVAAVTSLSSLINKWINKDGWFKQKMSWLIAIVVAMLAWLLNLGIFEPLLWWEAILTGFCGGLVANGVFDIPGVQELLRKLQLELPV